MNCSRKSTSSYSMALMLFLCNLEPLPVKFGSFSARTHPVPSFFHPNEIEDIPLLDLSCFDTRREVRVVSLIPRLFLTLTTIISSITSCWHMHVFQVVSYHDISFHFPMIKFPFHHTDFFQIVLYFGQFSHCFIAFGFQYSSLGPQILYNRNFGCQFVLQSIRITF